jgi:hypothetical protein
MKVGNSKNVFLDEETYWIVYSSGQSYVNLSFDIKIDKNMELHGSHNHI